MANVKYNLSEGSNDPGYNPKQRLRAAAFALSVASNPIRLGIIIRLSKGECGVGTLCTAVRLQPKSLSTYMSILARGGLIQCHQDGSHRYYDLTELGSKIARFVTESFAIKA